MTWRAGVPLSLVVLAAVAALGCGEARRADADGVDGGRDGSPDAGGGPGTDAGEGPPMDAGPDEIDDCPTSSLDAGDYRFDLEIDGGTRSFAMHVPPTVVDGTPLPLILNFHGFTANATQQIGLSQMDAEADRRGFVTVTPEGAGRLPSWNGGVCCGAAAGAAVDDVAFARALVADASERVCVDADRVYATGMSNGGFMSHRIACEAADVFAAIGPVAGVLGLADEDCAPSAPIPVIHFHGTADAIVPYDGQPRLGFRSVDDTVESWADRNGCVDEPEETLAMGNATCVTWDDCDGGAEVTRCAVEGFGHSWPGTRAAPIDAAIDATSAMWDFFDRLADR